MMRLATIFDLDSLVVLLIGFGSMLNIDSAQVSSVIQSSESIVSLLDDFLKLGISILSVLILYKKYKKNNE